MADIATLLLLAASGARAAADAAEQGEPAAFGLIGPAVWVALAMAVFVAVLLWKRVPATITRTLDGSIAEIRKQLDEASALRAEAEALRREYAARIANAEQDAAAMLAHARHEAEAIVAKATAETTAMIGRRERMAEDKIAAAERSALAEVRTRAATAAAGAAGDLIRHGHSSTADSALVDQAIAGI